jgi:predicted transposase YbfD/YdcC
VTDVDLHGDRIETRTLTASAALNDYLDWPSVGQVCCIERHVVCGARERFERAFAITSLGAARAGAGALLALSRGHWGVENRLHWVRDVTFDEDRSRVRTGHAPHVMAAIRNTAIGLHRAAGASNIAAATRRCAGHPTEALALIGLQVNSS